MTRALLLLLALLGSGPAARAVIVFGGDGTQNTTDPLTGVAWNRVGIVNGCTGIYLGEVAGADWVLTAAHVGAGSFSLGGISYTAVAGSAVSLRNADGTVADLLLYRIDGALTGALLDIAGETLGRGTEVTMIGYGRNRAASPITGYVDADGNWSATPTAGARAVTGYEWASGNAMRWGTNTVEGAATVTLGGRTTACLYTDLDAVGGEAQGAIGDSGGAVFSRSTGGDWLLSGTLLAIGGYKGQPIELAAAGNATGFADLAVYRGQIMATIPEPGAASVACGLAAGAVVWWRRRRGRADG